MRRHAQTSLGHHKRQKSPEEKVLDLLKEVPEKIVHKFLGKPHNLPQAAFTILYDEPKSANEVMGSKEGCRALFSPYD
jgi:hypothetical protein